VYRIAGRRVPFFVYDVALFTNLPATGMRVELDGEEVTIDVSHMVLQHMAKWE